MAHKRFIDGIGFVSVLQWTADDEIINIASITYGNKLSPENLMRFIIKAGHDSIFEMAHFMFHIKMPGTVAQQHHQTKLGNCHHLRDFPGEAYASPDMAQELYDMQDFAYRTSSSIYSIMKDNGVPDRDACMHIPVSTYTDFYWKVNGKELMEYIRKFSSVSDKYLIKQYSLVIQSMIASIVPIMSNAFMECKLDTITLDKRETKKLAQLVSDTECNKFNMNDMSKEEIKQFKKKVNKLINGNI